VKARAVALEHGTSRRLRFTVSDDSGRASVVAGIFRKSKRLRKWGPDMLDSGAYYVNWTAPAKAQKLSFCLTAVDGSGNSSGKKCAVVSVN
jgi:hypothetical protein